MKRFFNDLGNDKILFFGYGISFLFILLCFIYIILKYSKMPGIIPIFNQMPWGELRLGAKEQIFIPLLTTFVIFVLNYFLSSIFYKKMPLISRTMSITNVLVSLFTLLFIVRTIQLIV